MTEDLQIFVEKEDKQIDDAVEDYLHLLGSWSKGEDLLAKDAKTHLLAINGKLRGFSGAYFYLDIPEDDEKSEVGRFMGVTDVDKREFALVVDSSEMMRVSEKEKILTICHEAEHLRQRVVRPNMSFREREIGATLHTLEVYKELRDKSAIEEDPELDNLIGQIGNCDIKDRDSKIAAYLGKMEYNL
jgi:hypothetical protein